MNGDLLAFARGTGWSVVEDNEARDNETIHNRSSG
jgi:hypothetical protein